MAATVWVSVMEAAARLGVTHQTVRNWLAAGRLKGKKPRYDTGELDRATLLRIYEPNLARRLGSTHIRQPRRLALISARSNGARESHRGKGANPRTTLFRLHDASALSVWSSVFWVIVVNSRQAYVVNSQLAL